MSARIGPGSVRELGPLRWGFAQAAGRVIRTPDDQGSVHLIDDRFARPEVRRLLPRAIGCSTVEQYASGLVSRVIRDNLAGPRPAGWCCSCG